MIVPDHYDIDTVEIERFPERLYGFFRGLVGSCSEQGMVEIRQGAGGGVIRLRQIST